MVGFIDNSSIKVKEEEKKEAVQSVEVNKSLDTLDFSLPEVEDLSLSFADSFLDLDCLKDWMEGNSELFITDIKEDSGRIGTEKFDLEVEKSFEMGVEDICKQTNAEDGSGCLIEEELGKVSLEGVLDESVEIGANRGNGISEGVADIEKDVKSEKCEMENGVDGYKRSDEIVGIEGTKVKSSEIGIVECGGEKNDEIVGIEGCGIMSSEVSGFDGNRGVSGNTLTIDSDGIKGSEKMSDGEKSDSESESGSSSSASSSSSSSSSDEEDDDDDEEEVEEKEEGEMDVEEGEIRDSFGEEMVAWSDEDEEFGSTKAGPIMSVNEIKVLPPVPPVGVTLQPCHETLPVGVVLSTVGAQVVVEGVEKHNPLNEGSILWITEKRSPLGIVDEIFGPVKNPYYIVRYNSDSEVPAGIQQGTLISFVPEFVNHVLNNGNLYKKGYDASGENDEELSDIAEFSDDEKEAEFKRMQKMSKRGPKDQAVENRRKNKNKSKRRGCPWEGDQHSLATTPNERVGQVPSNRNHYFPPPSSNERASQVPSNQSHHFPPPSSNERVSQAPSNQNHHFAPPSSNERVSQVPSNQNHHFPPPSSLDRGNCSNPLPPFQAFSGGPGLVPVFPQVAQVPGFVAPSSGVWMNGIPCQPPQSVGFSNVPTPNNMMQLQQNHSQQPYHMPPFNGMPLQQQFNGQMFPSNFVLPGGQPSFGAGPTFTPMNPMMIGQNNFSQFQTAMSQNNFCQAAINMQGQHAINMQGQHAINLSQSQAAVGMQGQHAPPSLNNGEQGVSPTECGSEQNCSSQPLSASPAVNGGSQNFSSGVNFGRGRNSYRRGGGRFGGGRGRRQSR